jgi:2-polyprenyl-6-methoxyphenol hydroxylase-like FAD-dependent oxidoreductase
MKTKVLIVGAGPIGMLLANFLGEEGIDTVIIDKKTEFDRYSKAIGIMPPSFKILDKPGLFEMFLEKGLKITDAVVHGTNNVLGRITFRKNREYGYILSIPQCQTEYILYERLSAFKSVKILLGHEFKKIIPEKGKIETEICDISGGGPVRVESDFLIACDGNKSPVRSQLGIEYRGGRYKDTFLMGDFVDRSGLNDQAHLFFTKYGAVESFPLNGGQRRWIVQTEYFMETHADDFIENEVKKRTGFVLASGDRISESPFGVQHYVAGSYFKGNIVLCGDSAHSMSPIGGQGMNTGFADAEFLYHILRGHYLKPGSYDTGAMLEKYDRYRRVAAFTAIRRAEMSMKIGTIKGRSVSALRNSLIFLLMHTPLVNFIPHYFSMLTIKFRNFDRIKKKDYLEITG